MGPRAGVLRLSPSFLYRSHCKDGGGVDVGWGLVRASWALVLLEKSEGDRRASVLPLAPAGALDYTDNQGALVPPYVPL